MLGNGAADRLRSFGRGVECAFVDVDTKVSQTVGGMLHHDVSGQVRFNEQLKKRIIAPAGGTAANPNSRSFHLGEGVGNTVAVGAATIAVAAAAAPVLAVGAEVAVGLGATALASEAVSTVAVGVGSQAFGAGFVTAALGGNGGDVAKAAAFGGLAGGGAMVAKTALAPLVGATAKAVPRLAGAARIGAEATGGAASNALAAAATGGNREEVMQAAALGGVMGATTEGIGVLGTRVSAKLGAKAAWPSAGKPGAEPHPGASPGASAGLREPGVPVQPATAGRAGAPPRGHAPGEPPHPPPPGGSRPPPAGKGGGSRPAKLPGTIKAADSRQAMTFPQSHNVWQPGSAAPGEALQRAQTPSSSYKLVARLDRSGLPAEATAKGAIRDGGAFKDGILTLYGPDGEALPNVAVAQMQGDQYRSGFNSTSLVGDGRGWNNVSHILQMNGIHDVDPKTVQILREFPNQHSDVPGQDSFFAMPKADFKPEVPPKVATALIKGRPPELQHLPVTFKPAPQDGPLASLQPDAGTVLSAAGPKASAKLAAAAGKAAAALQKHAPDLAKPLLDRLPPAAQETMALQALDKSLLNPNLERPLVVPQAKMDQAFGPSSPHGNRLRNQLHDTVRTAVQAEVAAGGTPGRISGVTDIMTLAPESGEMFRTVGTAPTAQPYTVEYQVQDGTVTATIKSVVEMDDVYDWRAASDQEQRILHVPAVAGRALTPDYRDSFMDFGPAGQGPKGGAPAKAERLPTATAGGDEAVLHSHALLSTLAQHGVEGPFHTIGTTSMTTETITFPLEKAPK